MERLARIFAIVLLALFAAGTVAHAANATSMSLAMFAAMSDGHMGEGGMGDCDGCPPSGGGKAAFCAQFCLAPFAAIPVAGGFEAVVLPAEADVRPTTVITGRTGPPDPPPPRIIVL